MRRGRETGERQRCAQSYFSTSTKHPPPPKKKEVFKFSFQTKSSIRRTVPWTFLCPKILSAADPALRSIGRDSAVLVFVVVSD